MMICYVYLIVLENIYYWVDESTPKLYHQQRDYIIGGSGWFFWKSEHSRNVYPRKRSPANDKSQYHYQMLPPMISFDFWMLGV